MRMQPASRLPNLAKGHGHGYGPRWDMENNLKVLVGKRQSKGWGSELVAGGWCCLREGQSSERSKDRKCKNCENSSTYYCNDKGGCARRNLGESFGGGHAYGLIGKHPPGY
jgi:hypothetical protein